MPDLTKMTITYPPVSIIKILVYGTTALTVLFEALLITYQSEAGSVPREILLASIASVTYMIGTSSLALLNKNLASSTMTVYFYLLLSAFTLSSWGADHTVGLLILGFTIFLAGIVTSPKHIVATTALGVLFMFLVNHIHNLGAVAHADNPTTASADSLLTYACLFGVFGLASQTVSMYIKEGFKQAETANKCLQKQKEELANLLATEKQKLKDAHMEETRQLYMFAKIGQSTAVTLHELSNQIGVLNFDVEDLSEGDIKTRAIENIKDSVHQINSLIVEAKRRLRLRQTPEKFDVLKVIKQTLKESRPYMQSRGIALDAPRAHLKGLTVTGDPIDLTHAVTILIKNACDACSAVEKPRVSISLHSSQSYVSISVRDNGPGVPEHMKDCIFKPEESTKSDGLGIGLYLARRIVTHQFRGALELGKGKQTTFLMKIPLTR